MNKQNYLHKKEKEGTPINITKKTVIFMGYFCNNKCIFCCNEDRRKTVRDKSTAEIKQDMILARERGSDYIELIGGEPTIRRDILELLKFAKQTGFKTIMFSTNGRMFSYKSFAKKLIDAGLNHVVFSIHGHNAKLHDSLTQVKGSFSQLIRGINNVRELGFENIGSNTIIIKQNYKNLLDIGKLIYNLGIKNSEFIFIDPTHGAPKKRFFDLVPAYEEVSPYVNELLKFGKEHNIRHWDIRYYPFCFVKEEYHNMISELHEKATFSTQHLAPDFINLDVEKSRKEIARTKIKKCVGCKYYDKCEGYWKVYVKRLPNSEKSILFSN